MEKGMIYLQATALQDVLWNSDRLSPATVTLGGFSCLRRTQRIHVTPQALPRGSVPDARPVAGGERWI